MDCWARNFCWSTAAGKAKTCLEKHSAPDGKIFFWDRALFPVVTKEAVLHHG